MVKVEDMQADIAKVKNLCVRAEKLDEPRQLQQLLKEICLLTSGYIIK